MPLAQARLRECARIGPGAHRANLGRVWSRTEDVRRLQTHDGRARRRRGPILVAMEEHKSPCVLPLDVATD